MTIKTTEATETKLMKSFTDEKRNMIKQHMAIIRSEGYEWVEFASDCPDAENCFYYMAVKCGTKLELYTQQEDSSVELWILDDFGASTEDEGMWNFLQEYTV